MFITGAPQHEIERYHQPISAYYSAEREVLQVRNPHEHRYVNKIVFVFTRTPTAQFG